MLWPFGEIKPVIIGAVVIGLCFLEISVFDGTMIGDEISDDMHIVVVYLMY